MPDTHPQSPSNSADKNLHPPAAGGKIYKIYQIS